MLAVREEGKARPDVQLVSGATMFEVRLQMTETGSGISNPCTVTGSAIPVN
jgi:hypothetical protein